MTATSAPTPRPRGRLRRAAGLTALLLTAAFSASACGSNQVDPDHIGLHYTSGWAEGRGFAGIVQPGETSFQFNDNVIMLPTSLRLWRMTTEDDADAPPLDVVANDNTEIRIAAVITFRLNVDTEATDDYPGGMIQAFWENVGRRYEANTDDGWARMLRQTFGAELPAALRDVLRGYDSGTLVGNENVPEVDDDGAPVVDDTGDQRTTPALDQVTRQVSARLATGLAEAMGGEYFCDPDFTPGGDCGDVHVTISQVDYVNEDVRRSREEIVAASNRAEAQLVEAQAAVDARNALGMTAAEYNDYLLAQAALVCADRDGCVWAPGAGVAVR